MKILSLHPYLVYLGGNYTLSSMVSACCRLFSKDFSPKIIRFVRKVSSHSFEMIQDYPSIGSWGNAHLLLSASLHSGDSSRTQ